MNNSTCEEVWKEIAGFDGVYLASNLGRIKSIDRVNAKGAKVKGKILRPQKVSSYYSVALYKGSRGDKKSHYIHRLIAETFIPPFKGETVNHKDGNKLNNLLENLEWATWSENTKHAYLNELNKHNNKIRVVYPGGHEKILNSMKEASSYFGCNSSWINDRVKKYGDCFNFGEVKIQVIRE